MVVESEQALANERRVHITSKRDIALSSKGEDVIT